MHRVVGRLLAAGQHSPRLMAFVALQLTVAWVAAPTIALHYAAELEQLLLMDVGHHNSNKEVIHTINGFLACAAPSSSVHSSK